MFQLFITFLICSFLYITYQFFVSFSVNLFLILVIKPWHRNSPQNIFLLFTIDFFQTFCIILFFNRCFYRKSNITRFYNILTINLLEKIVRTSITTHNKFHTLRYFFPYFFIFFFCDGINIYSVYTYFGVEKSCQFNL